MLQNRKNFIVIILSIGFVIFIMGAGFQIDQERRGDSTSSNTESASIVSEEQAAEVQDVSCDPGTAFDSVTQECVRL